VIEVNQRLDLRQVSATLRNLLDPVVVIERPR
jgi:hypothetical protein